MSAGTVCLTFDFDAVSLWVLRCLRTPAPVSGGSSGLWRSREYSNCSTLVAFRPHGLSSSMSDRASLISGLLARL